jgi:hypothetical protein
MRIKLIIILSSIVLNLTAQTSKEVKTLFGTGTPGIGYFITPFCQFGSIAGSTAVIPGVGAGIVFNNNISLDLRYKFIATENTPAGEVDNRLYLDGQWFGIRGEYIFKPENAVHLSFPLEVGMGEIELDLKDSYEDQHVTIPSDEAWFFNLEPGVALEINLWKYMKLNLTAGYRFVSDITFRNLSENDLMGFTYSAALKIGIF